MALDVTEDYRSEHNWVRCWVRDSKFHAVGGPLNLREMVETFLNAVAEPDSGLVEQA
jgi:hypothetical protein